MPLPTQCLPLTLPLVLALFGCVSTEQQAKVAMDESLQGQRASYLDFQTYEGGVTCGQYLIATVWGGIENRDFVVVGTEAIPRPSKLDLAVYCSEDSLASLNKALDIDYLAQQETIDAIIADFNDLEGPLLRYEADNGHFPSTDQGLKALVKPSDTSNNPRNFPEGGYISGIPSDPWTNAYDYQCDPFAGVRVHYNLQSLGEDGKAGGQGINADIKSSYRRYFQHIKDTM